jgi:hypothetical protein
MVMDFLCCEPQDEKDSHSDGSMTASTDEGILECDYDTQVTKLYHSIEERQWEEVLYFLDCGKWYNSSIFSAFGEQGESPSVQSRTWVTALDETGNVRWCQLPLHAAVTFLAPFSVIAKLVEVYPKSVRCADDQDMLPLHYAFRFGAEDDASLHLLEKFPQAIGKKAVKDRLPLDLAQYGPRPERGSIIDYYMQSAVRNAKTEWDGEYENMVVSKNNESDSDLHNELYLKSDKLTDALSELAKTKKELQGLKRELSQKEPRGFMSSNASVKSNKSNKSIRRKLSLKSNGSKTLAATDEDITSSPQKSSDRQRRSKKEGAQKADESPNSRRGISQMFKRKKQTS